MNRPFHFHTSCVHSTAELIDEMCDQAEDVEWGEILENCAEVEDWVASLGPYDEWFHITDDDHVSFHKSRYDGQDCYYVQWSGIEFIWV